MEYGVFESERAAAKLIVPGQSKYSRFRKREEAWDWVNYHRGLAANDSDAAPKKDQPKEVPRAETPDPGAPPALLNGKDPSTKTEDEVFGLSLDIDGNTLRQELAPPHRFFPDFCFSENWVSPRSFSYHFQTFTPTSSLNTNGFAGVSECAPPPQRPIPVTVFLPVPGFPLYAARPRGDFYYLLLQPPFFARPVPVLPYYHLVLSSYTKASE